MNKDITGIKTAAEARQYAIDWQQWASQTGLSWGEALEWYALLQALADKFDLTEEFKENGIL